jgi:putative nucleotidyltransferase with HDIG domain
MLHPAAEVATGGCNGREILAGTPDMLIPLRPEQLAVGMYVHALDLPWHKHPFWRRRFLIQTAEELHAVQACGATTIMIDSSKGLAAAPPSAEAIADPARREEQKPEPAPPTQQHRSASLSFDERPAPSRPSLSGRARSAEVRRATRLLTTSKAQVMQLFDDARMGRSIRTKKMGRLVDQISDSVAKDPSIMLNVARLKRKDEYTFLHSVSVCALMINFARHLGMDEEVVRELGMAGMLHDVGKMAIPDAILNKPGKLDDAEFGIVKSHPEKGHEILSASKDVGQTALDICLLHHEKMDGSGYPRRVPADTLSIAVRMSAICDVYDAITSQRSYNRPFGGAEALAKMLTWHGHFDQLLLRSFIESLGIIPAGSVVRLQSNRLAVVIGEDPEDYTQAKVRTFYSLDAQAPVACHDIQLARAMSGEHIVAIEYDLPDELAQMGRIAASAAPPNQDQS